MDVEVQDAGVWLLCFSPAYLPSIAVESLRRRIGLLR